MAETFVARDADRLPWLTDDVKRPRRSANWVLSFLAASAVAVIAALSFWLGMNQPPQPRAVERAGTSQSATVALSVPAEPAVRQVEIAPMPQVQPAPQSQTVVPARAEEVRPVLEDAPPVRRVAQRPAVAVHRSRAAAPKSAGTKKKASPQTKGLKYTNPWESKGVSGRMVRVGAYSTLERGKEAWSRLAALSPAVKKLPAVVTDIPSASGAVYYWLQIGTTSQAHSEVLCQRMRAIGQRCVVVDLAGAQKGSRNGRQPVGL